MGTTTVGRDMAAELGEPPAEVADALEAAAADKRGDAEGETSAVVAHLDAAVAAAFDEGMSAAEIMGMLFYYAHNVAQSAREGVLDEQPE